MLRILSALALVLSLSLPSAAQVGPPLVQVYPEGVFPFCYTAHDGTPAGRLNDIAREIAKAMQIPLEQRAAPPKRVIHGLVAGENDLAITIKSYPEYQQGAWSSEEPVDYMELRAWSIGSDPGVTKKEDLQGKRVAVLQGYGYGGIRQFLDDPTNNATVTNEVKKACPRPCRAGKGPLGHLPGLHPKREPDPQGTPRGRLALLGHLPGACVHQHLSQEGS